MVFCRTCNFWLSRYCFAILICGGLRERLHDKEHLKFVALPDLWTPAGDPHHLRHAQPRGLGLKVSDEFTVPLCRGDHRQLHQAGNAPIWWSNFNISALDVAKDLGSEAMQSPRLRLNPSKKTFRKA